ncbi:MAG: 3-oxoadipate enol-lactonase [Candidatus Promineifilaceae bacterium]|nr:3-oxoadipate enol-lactonase [Candidatus Promineifilaceae bacterium]
MPLFLTVNGLTFHCKFDGIENGFPLVFINSLGTDLRIWDGLVPHFTDRYWLIRYDKRGHGLSDCPAAPYSIRDHAQDLSSLLDLLEIEEINLVGISVGGMIAQDFAANWPQRVRKLVLCDTAAAIGTAAAWNERINTLRQNGMEYLREAILARWFAPTFMDQKPAEYRGYGNMLVQTPVEGYTGTCEAIRDADLTETTRDIQLPALILCGSEDISTPPRLARSLLNLIPEADYAEIPGAAHLPCIELPQAMAQLIDNFLRVS